jgi:hypothetical protein
MRKMILSVVFVLGMLLPAKAQESRRLVLPNVSPFVTAVLGTCMWDMNIPGMLRPENGSSIFFPSSDKTCRTVPELSMGTTLLLWTVGIFASGSGPYTFEQTYAEAEKQGLVPQNGDFGGTYQFY